MRKATQKEGLGKDALLTRLGGWFGYYFDIDDVASGISQENGLLPEERQAYAQLVKIVEQYYAGQSGEVDEVMGVSIESWALAFKGDLDEVRIVCRLKSFAKEITKQLLQQPVQVDAGELLFGTDEHRAQIARTIDGDLDSIRDSVTKLLTHLSTSGNDMSDERIEVVEK